MWPIVVMSALPNELASVLTAIPTSQDTRWGSVSVHTGALGRADVVALACGVGKVQAAAATQFMVARDQPELVGLVGAVGALDPALQPGHVVIGDRLIEHDLDTRALAKRPQDHHVRSWKPDPLLVKTVAAAAEQTVGSEMVSTGTILTGDQCITDPHRRQALRAAFDGVCVDMEGAAVAGVCHHNDTPVAVVRIVSDGADGSTRRQFLDQLDAVGQLRRPDHHNLRCAQHRISPGRNADTPFKQTHPSTGDEVVVGVTAAT